MPPGFITSHPAPEEWQERIQRLDPELWIAWNEVDPNGPRWCIMRHHGRLPTEHGIPILSRETWDNDLVTACGHGWSFVGPLQDRSGAPCGLTDEIVAALVKNDWVRTYGKDKDEAAEKLVKEHADLEAGRQKLHDDLMADAFRDMSNDHALANNATSVVMPSEAVT